MKWNKQNARRWLEKVGFDLVKDACGLEAEGRILILISSARVGVDETNFRDILGIVLERSTDDVIYAVEEVRNGTGPASKDRK